MTTQRWNPLLCLLESGRACNCFDQSNVIELTWCYFWIGGFCFLPFGTPLPYCEEAPAAFYGGAHFHTQLTALGECPADI